eukprot:CAMPEP_0119493024 /NCGR_PEP_ID=MMETSP1344-20130328/17396_1 /TAXON_ID=236787 /ORGANISM="Florenciella parvula, Strain CCMP2471" /LENGTH=119 /DNA_ID=CAMNT_0007528413 /DNA_START=41 /DNA_END=397 /DNA_ORIENTATION=+
MNATTNRHVVAWGKHNCAILLLSSSGVLDAEGELSLELALDAASESNCIKQVTWLPEVSAGTLVVSTLTFIKIFDVCGATPLTPTHSYVLSYEASHIQNVAFVPANTEGVTGVAGVAGV